MIVAEKSWRLNSTIIAQHIRGSAARAFLEAREGGCGVRVGLPALLSSRPGGYVSRCAGRQEQEEQPQEQPQEPQEQEDDEEEEQQQQQQQEEEQRQEQEVLTVVCSMLFAA